MMSDGFSMNPSERFADLLASKVFACFLTRRSSTTDQRAIFSQTTRGSARDYPCGSIFLMRVTCKASTLWIPMASKRNAGWICFPMPWAKLWTVSVTFPRTDALFRVLRL
jgi:hypothetical protein